MHIAALFGGKSTITNFALKKFLNARFSVESKIFRTFGLVTTFVTGQSTLVPWYRVMNFNMIFQPMFQSMAKVVTMFF